VTFEHPEDRIFFRNLLCEDGEPLEKYAKLFDFRDVTKKRREFQAAHASLLENLRAKHGPMCMLHYSRSCTGGRGALTIDHLLPLSSNKLNKELRRVVPLLRRKVPTQSIGSNHIANLVLACATCNGAKKHRLLPRAELRRLLAVTSATLGGPAHALPNPPFQRS
jgi:5-methylcytosine-specific restriction endonuclease McrA